MEEIQLEGFLSEYLLKPNIKSQLMYSRDENYSEVLKELLRELKSNDIPMPKLK